MNKQQLRALESIHEMANGDNMSPEEIASLLEANCGIQTMIDEEMLFEMVGMQVYD